MTRHSIPKPSFLDGCEKYRTINGKTTWRCPDSGRYFQWDELHGEIEAYNRRGEHIGVLDSLTGETVKDAVRGRTINVK